MATHLTNRDSDSGCSLFCVIATRPKVPSALPSPFLLRRLHHLTGVVVKYCSRHLGMDTSPQIDSVGPLARRLTITIGGNDVNYLGSLSAQSCAHDNSRVPLLWRQVVCKPSTIDANQAFAQLPAHLTQAIRAVTPMPSAPILRIATYRPSSGPNPIAGSRSTMTRCSIASAMALNAHSAG